MVLNKVYLLFVSIFLVFLLGLSTVISQGWTHTNYKQVNISFIQSPYNTDFYDRPQMFKTNQFWYVLRHANWGEYGWWLHKINPVTRQEETAIELVPHTIAFNNGTTCNTTGGVLTIFNGCSLSQWENNNSFDVVCDIRGYKGSNNTYALKVFHVHLGDMTYEEWDIDIGGCTSGDRMFNVQFGNYGYMWTGSSERPIFYNNTDGWITRVRWETCSGGYCHLNNSLARKDIFPYDFDYVFQYQYQPIGDATTPLKCFGTFTDSYDCGNYVIYNVLRDPYPSYRNLYVQEVAQCPDNDWHTSCFVDPSCCIEWSTAHSMTKMIKGATDSYTREKEVDQFWAYQKYSGSTPLFYVLWHQYRYFDARGQLTTCPSDQCWHLSKYDQQWNEITTYNLNEFPFKGKDFTNDTSTGGKHWYLINYDVPSYYHDNSSVTVYSNCGKGNITVTDQSNSSNTQFLNLTCPSGNTVFKWNMTHFAGKTIRIDLLVLYAPNTIPRLTTTCSNIGFMNPFMVDPSLSTYQMTLGIGVEPSSGTDSCAGSVDGYIGEIFLSEEYTVCSCTGWTNTSECADEEIKQIRSCVDGCDIQERWVWNSGCAYGGCYPSAYYCYNSTTLGLRLADCTWTGWVNCTYGCNTTGNVCYYSSSCGACQNPSMTQRPFPDCTCSCSNWCTIYENISQDCRCGELSPLLNYTELKLNTSEWQSNPVSLFADIANGLFALVGGILVPLIIIFLAIGFATIIYLIMKKAVPKI